MHACMGIWLGRRARPSSRWFDGLETRLFAPFGDALAHRAVGRLEDVAHELVGRRRAVGAPLALVLRALVALTE